MSPRRRSSRRWPKKPFRLRRHRSVEPFWALVRGCCGPDVELRSVKGRRLPWRGSGRRERARNRRLAHLWSGRCSGCSKRRDRGRPACGRPVDPVGPLAASAARPRHREGDRRAREGECPHRRALRGFHAGRGTRRGRGGSPERRRRPPRRHAQGEPARRRARSVAKPQLAGGEGRSGSRRDARTGPIRRTGQGRLARPPSRQRRPDRAVRAAERVRRARERERGRAAGRPRRNRSCGTRGHADDGRRQAGRGRALRAAPRDSSRFRRWRARTARMPEGRSRPPGCAREPTPTSEGSRPSSSS